MTDPRTLASSTRRTPLWQVALVFVLLTALYSAVSIQQYNRMEAYIFDLGFFESVIRDYAHGNWPQLPLTDTTNASLHFSPALALLAPVVLLWSSPIAVLVAQAVAVAAGVVPLMRAAGAGPDGLGGGRQLRPRPRLRRPDRLRLPRGGAGGPAARVQHGGDAAQRPPRRRALGAAARARQGGPRPDGRGPGCRGVPAWVTPLGDRRDGGRRRQLPADRAVAAAGDPGLRRLRRRVRPHRPR